MISFGVSWARAIVSAALCIGALTAFSQSSQALNANNYCRAGDDPTRTSDTVSDSLLSVNDVNLWAGSVYTPSNCYGNFDPGNSSPANETAAINQIFGDISNQFVYLDKTGGAPNATGLSGVKFEVYTLGGDNGAPGLWSIVWTDTSGSQAFPLKVDLVVLLVGGNQSAAYLLTGILVPFSPGIGIGTFDIQFPGGSNALRTWCRDDDDDRDDYHYSNTSHKSGSNKNDKNKKHDKDCKPEQPDISHLLIAGRVVPARQVPEPATMAMFGAGLVGLWAFCRRRYR